jgi:hypothetical protein
MSLTAFGALGIPIPAKSRQPPKPNYTNITSNDNFIKHSHSFAMTIFHKINNSAKLVTLLIIPTYAKVSNDFYSQNL